jgi:outer membrane protein TolC
MGSLLISFAQAIVATTVLAGSASPAPPLTLDQAIAGARQANAQLPVVALDRGIAEQRQREAAAQRRVIVSAEGDVWIAPASAYDPIVTNLGEERLQVIAEKTIYDGGALAARQQQAQAEVGLAQARYRQAAVDVDRQVRGSFAGLLAARREVARREEGLERLRHYLTLLEGRVHAGQPLTADLLGARVRLATDTAALLAARGRAGDARAALDVLMGLPPDAPLTLAPLPAPVPLAESPAPAGAGPELPVGADVPTGPPTGGADASAVPEAPPDIAVARQQAATAAAHLAAARAEKSPQVTLRGDAGLWGSDPLHLVPDDFAASHPGATVADRLQRDLGASISLSVRLPLFGTGGVDARVAQAELGLEQARRGVIAAQTQAELERAQARQALVSAYEQYRLLTAALPVARDATLDAESRYWGGAAGYLEVLGAFSAAVDTAVGQAQAELSYRQAEARLRRWGGTP